MPTCFSCKADAAEGTLFCPACGKILPVGENEDHFSLLGLPRQYALDAPELERRFRDLSRKLHPDRFARADVRERRISLERTTRLNEAYRRLKDWRLRAAYLLELVGVDVFTQGQSHDDPEFLEEQIEQREELGSAIAAGDAVLLRRVATGARERLLLLERGIAEGFADERWYPERAPDIARRLARVRYYENVAQDAERAGAGVLA